MHEPGEPLSFSDFCNHVPHRQPEHLYEAYIRVWQAIEELAETSPSCVWAWALGSAIKRIDEILGDIEQGEAIDFDEIKKQGPDYVTKALSKPRERDESDESDEQSDEPLPPNIPTTAWEPVEPSVYLRLFNKGDNDRN